MAKGIHGHNLLLVAPLGKRSNSCGRLGIGEVRLVGDIKIATCYSESVVD